MGFAKGLCTSGLRVLSLLSGGRGGLPDGLWPLPWWRQPGEALEAVVLEVTFSLGRLFLELALAPWR